MNTSSILSSSHTDEFANVLDLLRLDRVRRHFLSPIFVTSIIIALATYHVGWNVWNNNLWTKRSDRKRLDPHPWILNNSISNLLNCFNLEMTILFFRQYIELNRLSMERKESQWHNENRSEFMINAFVLATNLLEIIVCIRSSPSLLFNIVIVLLGVYAFLQVILIKRNSWFHWMTLNTIVRWQWVHLNPSAVQCACYCQYY